MSRYIDAEILPALFNEKFKETQKLIEAGETQLDNLAEGFAEAEKIVLFKAPTADVQEVRRGRWELIEKNASKCTVCGCSRNIETQFGWNFCPNCGAKMKYGDTENKGGE